MTQTIGRNTIAGELLRGFVERVESIEAQITALRDDKNVIMAEAKAANLLSTGIRYIVKKRKMKPSERAEAEAANVKKIFDAAEACTEPLVLFFDEFDTLGGKRMHSGGANSLGEHDHNAKVNTLLARMEAYKSFIIAATNNASSIDEAVWRRFEIHIKLETPGQFERERIIARYLAPFGLPAIELKALGEAFETGTPALIRGFCENLKRQIVIGPKCDWDMRKGPTVERLLAAIHPHPDLGNPRLWTHGAADHAIRMMPWPLPKAADIVQTARADETDSNVIPLTGTRP